MTKRTQRLVLMIASIALALPALAGVDIIPCVVGNKWTYDCYKMYTGDVRFKGKSMSKMSDASFGTSTYEVLAMDKSASPIYEYRESTKTSSSTGGSDSNDQVDLRLANDAAGQHVVSSYQTSTSMDKADRQDYDPHLLYFAGDAAVGKEWTVGSMREENTLIPMTAKVVGKETVTVPAGTFKDCLRVVYSSDAISGTVDVWQKQFNITSGKSRGVYWVAEGIGVVKELEVATSTAESAGPDGTPVTIESSSCSVSELRPGFVVKK